MRVLLVIVVLVLMACAGGGSNPTEPRIAPATDSGFVAVPPTACVKQIIPTADSTITLTTLCVKVP